MKLFKSLLMFLLILSLWPTLGCSPKAAAELSGPRSIESEANSPDLEYNIKANSAVVTDRTSEAKRLKVVQRLQTNLGGQDKFMLPVSLAVPVKGGVYVSDNNAHVVRYCRPELDSIDTFATSEGPGKLVWPNWIRIWRDLIFVSDNEGIKIYKESGLFERLLRVFYQINHFAISPEGRIYINPSFSNQKTGNPLIVEVDRSGKRVKAFGVRSSQTGEPGLANEVYLCATPERVIAVFEHRPLVRIYDVHGELVREFNVSHPAFGDLAPLGQDKRFTNPQPNMHRLPKYLAGAAVAGGRLLVLLDMPQPEIVAFNFDGVETGRFRAAVSPPSRRYQDFDARFVDGSYRFWILYGDAASFIALAELMIADES